MNRRAHDYLDKFWLAQSQLRIPHGSVYPTVWQPPPQNLYKENFDVASFSYPVASGFGVIIRNEKGVVVVAQSAMV